MNRDALGYEICSGGWQSISGILGNCIRTTASRCPLAKPRSSRAYRALERGSSSFGRRKISNLTVKLGIEYRAGSADHLLPRTRVFTSKFPLERWEINPEGHETWISRFTKRQQRPLSTARRRFFIFVRSWPTVGRDRSIRSSGAHLGEEDDESELSCTTRIEEAQDLPLFLYVVGRGRGPCGSVLRLQFLREMFLRTQRGKSEIRSTASFRLS